MIVVDASVLAPALAYDVPEGDAARVRLGREQQLFAPEIVDLELAAVWRGAIRTGRLDEQRSRRALADLAVLRLVRVRHRMLMPRIWELRHNLTPYDAAYVALAETLDATLLTADGRSARAPSLRCDIELLR
ncbi:MAG: type II toxin-antitoxin system VapC family toxin [Solirubrobacterales bacterium]